MKNNFENVVVDFLTNYHEYVGTPKVLKKKCNQIAKINAKNKGLVAQKIKFRETESIGIVGTVNPQTGEIFLNQTRSRILTTHKISTTTQKGLQKFLGLKNKLEKKSSLTNDEKILLKFLNNEKWQPYFHAFGNYKMLNFETLACILHENQHLAQLKFLNEVFEKDNFETAQKFPYETFVATFQTIFDELYKAKNLQNFERKNEFFPIEIDAEYSALSTIQNLTLPQPLKKDFQNWKKLNNRLKNINTCEGYINKIFEDFDYLYQMYNKKYKNKLKKYYFLIKNNKKLIFNKYISVFKFYNK